MAKLYQYTIYRADGSVEALPPQPKFKDWNRINKLIGSDIYQLVPTVYYPDTLSKRATAYCDEEGLLTGRTRNPHFKLYRDPLFNDTSCIVGDVLVQEVYHGE